MIFDAGVARFAKGGKKRAENLVRATLSKIDPIYAIFVSHLDYDHVSLVPYILKNYKVYHLVVPRFSCEQVASYLLYFFTQGAMEGSDFIRIAYPGHFGDGPENIERPTIIYVNPIDSEDRREIVPADLLPLAERPAGARVYEVRSGNQIDIWRRATDCAWAAVPFVQENRKSTALAFWNDLVQEYYPCLNNAETRPFFCGEHNAYEKLREFIKCALDLDTHKKLKDIYRKHWGNINKDSMVVASFPMRRCQERFNAMHLLAQLSLCPDYCWTINMHRLFSSPGALYTGDGNAGGLPLQIMRKYDLIRRSVSSIQVPHHGSVHSWDPEFAAANEGKFFFAGYGAGNIYGHPSPLVAREIIRHKGIPYFYSENHPPVVQRFMLY